VTSSRVLGHNDEDGSIQVKEEKKGGKQNCASNGDGNQGGKDRRQKTTARFFTRCRNELRSCRTTTQKRKSAITLEALEYGPI